MFPAKQITLFRRCLLVTSFILNTSLADQSEQRALHNIQKRIVNGELVQTGKLPWMVHLRNIQSENGYNSCTAFLVSDRWIITAKHCIVGFLTSTETLKAAIFGSQGNDIPSLSIKRIVNHPFSEYFDRRDLYDITMLELAGVCSHVPPLKLDFSLISDEKLNALSLAGGGEVTASYVAGWGRSNIPEEFASPRLRLAQTPLQTFSDIALNLPGSVSAKEYGYYLYAGHFNQSGPESCDGDSGSPLWLEQNNTTRAVAITVAGFGGPMDCGEPGKLGIYLRLSRFEDFIISTKGLDGNSLWEWRASQNGVSPTGSWHANGDYSDPEKICQIEGNPGVYDSKQSICFKLSDDYAFSAASHFRMPVGTLDYDYQWQSGQVISEPFSGCSDDGESGSGSGLLTPACQEYCRAPISGKKRVGIVLNGDCLTINDNVLTISSPPYERLLARAAENREEVCPVVASSTTSGINISTLTSTNKYETEFLSITTHTTLSSRTSLAQTSSSVEKLLSQTPIVATSSISSSVDPSATNTPNSGATSTSTNWLLLFASVALYYLLLSL